MVFMFIVYLTFALYIDCTIVQDSGSADRKLLVHLDNRKRSLCIGDNRRIWSARPIYILYR